MGIIVKQSLKASIVSYIGVFIGAFNSLYLFPKFIGAEGIGVINVISASASLFLPVLQLGFNTSLIKYFPVFKEKQFFTTFITYAFLIPLFALGVFVVFWPVTQGLFRWLFEENAHVVFDNIFWVLPLTGILVLFGLLESLSRANFKIVFPTFVRNVVWRLSMTFGISLIGLNYLGLEDIAGVLVWAWFFSFSILAIYVFISGNLKFGFNKGIIFSKSIKKFNSFSGYVILVALGATLVQRIDQLMVASYLDTESAGVFSTAMYFATLIEIPKRSVIGIVQPVLVEAFKNEDLQKVDELYKKTSINLFLIGGILFIMVWINVFDIFELIPRNKEFLSGVYVVFFYGLARVVDMGMGCNNEIIVYSKYYKVNLPLQFFLVIIVIVTNALFIPKFNIVGAALATFVSIVTYNILRFVYLIWKLKIQPFSKKTLVVLCLLFVFITIGLILPIDFESINNLKIRALINIGFRTTIVGIPLLLSVYFLSLSTIINGAINRLLIKLKK